MTDARWRTLGTVISAVGILALAAVARGLQGPEEIAILVLILVASATLPFAVGPARQVRPSLGVVTGRATASSGRVARSNKGIDPTSEVVGYHESQRARVMRNTLCSTAKGS